MDEFLHPPVYGNWSTVRHLGQKQGGAGDLPVETFGDTFGTVDTFRASKPTCLWLSLWRVLDQKIQCLAGLSLGGRRGIPGWVQIFRAISSVEGLAR